MQKRILIIIVIILLLGVAVGLTVFVLNKSKTNSNSNGNANTVTTTNSNTNKTNTNVRTLTEEEKQRIEIVRIANIFAEQYGTYNGALTSATVNGFKELVTTSLLAQIQKQANDDVAASATSSVKTMVLASTIQSFTKGTGAVVAVSTLRTQTQPATNTNTSTTSTTQTLTLGLFFLDNAWKIQTAQWGTPSTAPSVNQ